MLSFSVIDVLIWGIQLPLAVFFAVAVLYCFVFAAASGWARWMGRAHASASFLSGASLNDASSPTTWPSLAVLIPAYKEDQVIVHTARAACEHAYPGTAEVFVLADSLRASTREALSREACTVIPIELDASTKPRAINQALTHIDVLAFDGIAVLDADNVMAPGALAALARPLAAGAVAVQGRRVAKNGDSSWSQLDGFSEAINNSIFRRGHDALGLSSALIGSAMAFDASTFARLMQPIETPTGFDKELELRLLREGHRVAYAPEAVVYDEKVSRADTFLQQRSRWMGAQRKYLRRYGAALWARDARSVDYLDKVFQMLLPPRGVLLGVLSALALAALLVQSWAWSAVWLLLTAVLATALALAVPDDRNDLSFLVGMWTLPMGVIRSMQALLLSRRDMAPNTRTPHQALDVSDP